MIEAILSKKSLSSTLFILLYRILDYHLITMLKPSYKYIAFDFETTGLDVAKDEPIQIWIVIFDEDFNVTDTFSSLIRPKKKIKELKTIVSHLTWFNLLDLQEAPTIEDLLPKLKKYFTGNIVAVWHNISFDIAILQKYLEFKPSNQFDTYILAKTFYHFLPSYALDVINEHLRTTNSHRESWSDSYHDALHDSYLGYNLFKQCMGKLTKLRREFLILDYMIQHSDGDLQTIIKRTQKPYKFQDKELFFPPLQQKKYHSNKKIINNEKVTLEYNNLDELDISKSSAKELVEQTDWGETEWLIACTHQSKIDILEKHFKKNHINVSKGHNTITFDKDRVNKFLHKDSFDDSELLFCLKYYSQFEQQHSFIDINSQDDYKIFSALSTSSQIEWSKITLCTHQQLFEKKNEFKENKTLLFLDKDRRYQSYNRITRQQFDPTFLINHIEQIIYKYQLIWHEKAWILEDLLSKTMFLHAVLCMEINPLFKWIDAQKIEIFNLIQDTRFPKSRSLISQRNLVTSSLEDSLLEEDRSVMWKIEKFKAYLNWDTTITKRMHSGDRRYYQFQHTNSFVDRNEFLDHLPKTSKTLFLSNSKTNKFDKRISHSFKKDTVETLDFLNIITCPDIDSLIQKINLGNDNCFVVSSDKAKSKLLFDKLVTSGANKKFELLWENITWWVWKNLYRWSISKKPLVLIWWYNYFLSAISNKLQFKTAYLYHLHGKLARQIVQDMMRWWEKN